MSNASLIRQLNDAAVDNRIQAYTLEHEVDGRWIVKDKDGELHYWTSNEVRAFLLGLSS